METLRSNGVGEGNRAEISLQENHCGHRVLRFAEPARRAGEELPHVSHYYTEPHEYWNQDVAVIGGKNSAAEAALDLYRNGARVTLVHRGKDLGATIKYWVRPDIENRIKAGQIKALLNARVEEITKTKWRWSSTLKQRESRLCKCSC